MSECSSHKAVFEKGTDIWSLYQKLKEGGVEDTDLDQGYYKTDFVNKKRILVHDNDCQIQEQEVLSYALEKYEKYRGVIKGTVGYEIPWVLDAETSKRVTQVIKEFEQILVSKGYAEGTDEYSELLAVSLYGYAMVPKQEGVLKAEVPQDIKQELGNKGLKEVLSYLENRGGLGLGKIELDCEIEATATEALRQGCGECTEQSKILYAIFKMAGLDVSFVQGKAKYAAVDFQKEPVVDHFSLGLILDRGMRVFDAAQKRSDAEPLYRMVFDYWFMYTNREILSSHYSDLGGDYVKKSDFKSALSELRKAVQIDPNSPLAHNNLGNVYEKIGELNLAVSGYQEAIEINPHRAESHYNLGSIYAKQGKMDLAIEKYKEAIEIYPHYAEAHLNLGVAYRHEGELDLAVSEYEKIIQIDPDHARAHNNLGSVYIEMRKFDLAIATLKRAIQIDPNYAAAHDTLGTVYKNMGKMDLAIAEHQRAIEIDPNFAMAHYNLGNAYNNRGEFALAIGAFKKAVQIEPNHARAHHNLGIAYKNIGELDLAIKEFVRAIDIDSEDAIARFNLGNTYYQKGNLNLAAKEYEVAIKIDPDFVRAYKNLGGVNFKMAMDLLQEGKIEEAISRLNQSRSCFENIIRINPDNIGAAMALQDIESKLQTLMRHYPDSEEAADSSKDIKGDSSTLVKNYCDLGEKSYKKNELAKALSYYQKAAGIDPKSEQAWLGIWNTYKALEDKENARKACEQYKELTGATISCE